MHQHRRERVGHHEPQHHWIADARIDDGQAAHRPAQHSFHVNEIGQLGHVPTVPPVPSVCFSPSTGRMMTVSGVVGADIFAPIVSFSPTARAPI